MTPVFNSVRHDPENGLYGDCHRVCIASLLDLPANEVEHFCDGTTQPPETWDRQERWLNARGLSSVNVVFPGDTLLEDIFTTQNLMNPDHYYILGGNSSIGCGHSVVCKGGEIVHDPSGGGIVAPMPDSLNPHGFYWITYLVPLFMKGK
jgi:hypothetical protein